jgi:ubiquinone/menaquinone biosynthesis C-methylase UbiE
MSTTAQMTGTWDAVAAGYDEFVTPSLAPLAEDLLTRIELRTGTRLLDVAAGTGALSFPAARLGAQVIATDIAPSMIERLQARATVEGLSNIEGRVMDACELELEDASFDVSASQLGVTVIPDLRRALGEMVRVTKPGRQVLIAALGPPHKAEFLGYFLAALRATLPGFADPPTDPPPPQFQAADPATLRERLAEAGLEEISVETTTFGLEIRSAAHLWGLLMNSNPMGRMLVADLTEEQRTAVREVLSGMLRERAEPNGTAVLNVDVNIARATKRGS